MSEAMCLQWNNFKENVNSAFGNLRNDKEFTNVTLACDDGPLLEAHKVILAASSPFFEKILKKCKHPYPLIYLRGFQSKEFVSILDFLYTGEANVYQEDLDSFLAIAEEIQLKGLTNQSSSALIEEQEKSKLFEQIHKSEDFTNRSTTRQQEQMPKETPTTVAIPNQSISNLQAHEERVKSMIEKGQRIIQYGNRANGMPKQEKSWICKVCGKEGRLYNIKEHIEYNHLEGVSIPCDFCGNTFQTRHSLNIYKNKRHK